MLKEIIAKKCLTYTKGQECHCSLEYHFDDIFVGTLVSESKLSSYEKRADRMYVVWTYAILLIVSIGDRISIGSEFHHYISFNGIKKLVINFDIYSKFLFNSPLSTVFCQSFYH